MSKRGLETSEAGGTEVWPIAWSVDANGGAFCWVSWLAPRTCTCTRPPGRHVHVINRYPLARNHPGPTCTCSPGPQAEGCTWFRPWPNSHSTHRKS